MKILQERYLAKLMACRRISFKEHMKKGAHLLEPGPASVEGGFVREFMMFLDGISVDGQSTREREGSPL